MNRWLRFWVALWYHVGLLLLSIMYPPLVLRWLYLRKPVKKLWSSMYHDYCEAYGAAIFEWLTKAKGVCVRDALAYLNALFGV